VFWCYRVPFCRWLFYLCSPSLFHLAIPLFFSLFGPVFVVVVVVAPLVSFRPISCSDRVYRFWAYPLSMWDGWDLLTVVDDRETHEENVAGKWSPDDRSEFRHTKRHFKYCRLSILPACRPCCQQLKREIQTKIFHSNRIHVVGRRVLCTFAIKAKCDNTQNLDSMRIVSSIRAYALPCGVSILKSGRMFSPNSLL
jgi:hypothetical protein